MLKANFKSAFFITLTTTLIVFVGCSSPEEKKAAQIGEALTLAEQGSGAEALKLLEELSAQYPNDIRILESMGQVYASEGDATMAAFFLEQAHLQSPEDDELLYQTYRSLEAAGQPVGHLLEKLAEQAPDTMTPDLWKRLGQTRKAENKVQSALDAYLKGVDPESAKPSAETAAAIGQLYAKVGNFAQAETWLELAADNDDPNALTALFELLEINLRQKDWSGAEAVVTQLDKQFPGAVEASQWQQARQELLRWRKAQDEMKAKLAAAEEAKKAAAAEANAEANAEGEAEAEAEKEATAEREATDTSSDNDTSGETETVATEGKAQAIADMEAAEAMADAPAIEIGPNEGDIAMVEESGETAVRQTITFDPSIAIEPADPEITFEVDFDQAPLAGETSYRVDNTTPIESVEAFSSVEIEDPTETIRSTERPATIEELLADAETAELDRDFKSAIRKYWAAISIANNRAEIWNLLSRAYLVDGQLNNADTTALEAVRLAPREVAYTLDYLRVAQRTKQPEAFLRELETAYARFPASPEITLSLARAHERISEQTETARNLYLRFVDIAPNHPLVPEARAAAARLR